MDTKMWIELAMAVLSLAALIGIFVTKTAGFGPATTQAIILSIGVPAIVILGLENILNGQVVAGLLGGALGFGISKAGKEVPTRGGLEPPRAF
jgi:hypothetical protein